MPKGKIERIILFRGDIETTGYFSEQMEKTLIANGYQTIFYDYECEKASLERILPFIQRGKTAIVTFNYHGIAGPNEVCFDEASGRFMWEDFDIPYINIVVDHPFYYDRFLKQVPPNYYHVSIDRYHDAYMTYYYPEIKRGPFLPLAGTSLHEKGDYKPISERSMDIVFTGNYTKPEDFDLYIERHGDEYADFYRGMIKELLDQPDLLLEDVARRHILREIPEATDDDIKETISNMIFLDMYIRFFYRGEAVRVLAEAGYKVHIFGGGWEDLECKNPENLILGGSLNSLQCLEKISDAKISLNVMPWFKDGAHDRIFNTMANGAVCVTDGSIYLHEIIEDQRQAAFYTLEEIDKLPQVVGDLLANPEKMQTMADEAFSFVMKEHMWKQRTEVVIREILEKI